jgi:hypothetical protein
LGIVWEKVAVVVAVEVIGFVVGVGIVGVCVVDVAESPTLTSSKKEEEWGG